MNEQRETHLFILFIDQSFLLSVGDGQRQRKVCLTNIPILLTQTKTKIQTHIHKNITKISDLTVLNGFFSEFFFNIGLCWCASCLHPPAFPLQHHHASHVLDALSSVVLIVNFPRHVLQILHVRPHQHVPQQQEVGVSRVLH